MKRAAAFLLALLLLLVAVLPVVATTRPYSDAVADTMDAVTAAVGVDTPGAAVVLFEGGERVMLEGFGYADIASRTVVSADTVFELGRLSSLFLILAAEKLDASGAFYAQKDIATYLPEKVMNKLSLDYPVTTFDLLFCKAGFEGRTFDLRFDRDAYCFDTLEQALLAEVPRQIAAPDTYYSYSEFSLGLAALVIEYVSGKSYAEYVTEEILEPLGMHRTVIDPRASSRTDSHAAGHIAAGEGSFALAAGRGYGYSGIVPADGAISTAADLSLLLAALLENGSEFLNESRKNGASFHVGMAGADVFGRQYALVGGTEYFGASLLLDAKNGRAALVLTNTADSALLALPAALYDETVGNNLPGDLIETSPIELSELEGVYVSAAAERRSLVGRLFIKDNSHEVVLGEDGTLSFMGMQLKRYSGLCFFETGDAELSPIIAVEFRLDEEGKVSALLTADGTTYLPVAIYERSIPSLLLFFLLIVGAAYFLLGAVFVVGGAIRAKLQDEERAPWRFVFPWLFSGLLGLCTLLQVWVAVSIGSAAIASFFTAVSVIALLLSIVATVCHLIAFFTAFTERGRTSRVVSAAILFLVFFALCGYWNVILI